MHATDTGRVFMYLELGTCIIMGLLVLICLLSAGEKEDDFRTCCGALSRRGLNPIKLALNVTGAVNDMPALLVKGL